MTATPQFVIRCNATEAGEQCKSATVVDGGTLREALAAAHVLGWRRLTNHSDACPAHALPEHCEPWRRAVRRLLELGKWTKRRLADRYRVDQYLVLKWSEGTAEPTDAQREDLCFLASHSAKPTTRIRRHPDAFGPASRVPPPCLLAYVGQRVQILADLAAGAARAEIWAKTGVDIRAVADISDFWLDGFDGALAELRAAYEPRRRPRPIPTVITSR
jgi:hypothetical protein